MFQSASNAVSATSRARAETLCLPIGIAITEMLPTKLPLKRETTDYLGSEINWLLSKWSLLRAGGARERQDLDGQGRGREDLLHLYFMQLQSKT